jgi:hypothetical protein
MVVIPTVTVRMGWAAGYPMLLFPTARSACSTPA